MSSKKGGPFVRFEFATGDAPRWGGLTYHRFHFSEEKKIIAPVDFPRPVMANKATIEWEKAGISSDQHLAGNQLAEA